MVSVDTQKEERVPRASIPILDAILKSSGTISNLFQSLACSPAALGALWGQAQSLKNGMLSPREREAIALRVAQISKNDYCLASHTARSAELGLDFATTIDFRVGVSDDPREQAILDLATKLAVAPAQSVGAEVAEARARNVSEEEIAEIVANVILCLFAKMICSTLEVHVDAPEVGHLAETDAA